MGCIFKYVITVDTGVAPCVDEDFLSICICKPSIRRIASIGDWVVATGGVGISREKKIIFAAKITSKVSMEEYAVKYPKRKDSIYDYDGLSLNHKGGPIHNTVKLQNLDKKGIYCLISKKFWYYGKHALILPERLKHLHHSGRGHSKSCDKQILHELEDFFYSKRNGKLGPPNHIFDG